MAMIRVLFRRIGLLVCMGRVCFQKVSCGSLDGFFSGTDSNLVKFMVLGSGL